MRVKIKRTSLTLNIIKIIKYGFPYTFTTTKTPYILKTLVRYFLKDPILCFEFDNLADNSYLYDDYSKATVLDNDLNITQFFLTIWTSEKQYNFKEDYDFSM